MLYMNKNIHTCQQENLDRIVSCVAWFCLVQPETCVNFFAVKVSFVLRLKILNVRTGDSVKAVIVVIHEPGKCVHSGLGTALKRLKTTVEINLRRLLTCESTINKGTSCADWIWIEMNVLSGFGFAFVKTKARFDNVFQCHNISRFRTLCSKTI